MSGPVDRGDARAAFEAYFFKQMLSETKLLGGSGGAATFDSMVKDALADQIASSTPLGIGEMLIPPEQEGAVMPVVGRITSAFGHRTDPFTGERRHHDGLDVAAAEGAPVRAARAGRVSRVEQHEAYGLLVVVEHGDGLQTRYAHLSDAAVKPGTELEAGQVLGAVGQSGRATGAHLHFEVRRHEKAIDPHVLLNP